MYIVQHDENDDKDEGLGIADFPEGLKEDDENKGPGTYDNLETLGVVDDG